MVLSLYQVTPYGVIYWFILGIGIMAKKRKGTAVWLNWDTDSYHLSDGRIILRPEIRIEGPFDKFFSKCFFAVFEHRLNILVFDEMERFLPSADDDLQKEVTE